MYFLYTLGPPKVAEKYLKKVHGEYELSLQVYPGPAPIIAEWYKGTEQLANSSVYTQTVAEVLTHRRLYGKIVTTDGYLVKLAIKKTSADQNVQKYSVSVANSIGHVTEHFVTGEKGNICI